MPLQTMYPAKLGSPQTTLAAALSADATVMILTDSSVLPPAPNIAVLGVDENCEIVQYTAIDISTNTVSGLLRAQGGSSARVWSAGTVVARNSTSLDHNRFKENIEALDNEKLSEINWGDIGGSISDQIDLLDALDTLAPKASPALTGTPTAPTAARGTDTTQLATTAFVQDALVTGFRDVYKVTLPSASSSKMTFTATGITANHVMVIEGYAYFSNPSAVASKLTIATSANKITIAGTLSGTTDIIVTLGIPRTITAS